MTEAEIIKALKENTSAFGLLLPSLQEMAMKIGKKDFLCFQRNSWVPSEPSRPFNSDSTYRLDPDYDPPREEWGWVEFEIFKTETVLGVNEYRFRYAKSHTMDICYAAAVEGFGGIKYRWPHEEYLDTDFRMSYPGATAKNGPAAPIKIRFWRKKGGA